MDERYREASIDEEEARKGIFRAGNEAQMVVKRDRMAIASGTVWGR